MSIGDLGAVRQSSAPLVDLEAANLKMRRLGGRIARKELPAEALCGANHFALIRSFLLNSNVRTPFVRQTVEKIFGRADVLAECIVNAKSNACAHRILLARR